MLSHKIQEFLQHKLQEVGMSKKELAVKAHTAYSVILELSKGYKTNPELKTLKSIADTLNTSIDEMCGRDIKYYKGTTEFRDITDKEAIVNLKNAIKDYLSQTGLTPHKLGRLAGFSSMSVSSFVGDTPKKNTLGSAIVVGVADYFEVSIDEMIGRTLSRISAQMDKIPEVRITQKSNALPPSIEGLSSADREIAKMLGKNLVRSVTTQDISTSLTASKVPKVKSRSSLDKPR